MCDFLSHIREHLRAPHRYLSVQMVNHPLSKDIYL